MPPREGPSGAVKGNFGSRKETKRQRALFLLWCVLDEKQGEPTKEKKDDLALQGLCVLARRLSVHNTVAGAALEHATGHMLLLWEGLLP